MSVPYSRPEDSGIRADPPRGVVTDDLHVDPDLWAYQENDTSDDPRTDETSVTICWAIDRTSSEFIEVEKFIIVPDETIGPITSSRSDSEIMGVSGIGDSTSSESSHSEDDRVSSGDDQIDLHDPSDPLEDRGTSEPTVEEYPVTGHVTTEQWASAFASTDGGFVLADVVEFLEERESE